MTRKGLYPAPALDSDTEPSSKYENLRCIDFGEGNKLQRYHVQSERELPTPLVGVFKNHSLSLGLMIGFFVQFSTLGASYLILALWGNDVVNKTQSQIVVLSAVWSAFTAFIAILTVGLLRSVTTITLRASLPRDHNIAGEAILEEKLLHLESHFVMGAFVGVCLAWTVTDILLGMNIQIIFSLITLVISLLWCKLMMYCFNKNESSLTHHEADEQDSSRGPHFV